MAATQNITGVGRRKSSTATVKITSGKGSVIVNGQKLEDYFSGNEYLYHDMLAPLSTLGIPAAKQSIELIIKGGGHAGQVDAARLAIAKAMAEISPENRSTLKKAGFLRRDARVKERKKPGLKGARKKEQFSKR